MDRKATKVRRFKLFRKVDETGMSGTGYITEGVELDGGICVMWWLVSPGSVQIYPSIEDLEAIHSHGRGTTEVVWQNANYEMSNAFWPK